MCWWKLFKQRSLFWLYQVARSNWKGILKLHKCRCKACLLAVFGCTHLHIGAKKFLLRGFVHKCGIGLYKQSSYRCVIFTLMFFMFIVDDSKEHAPVWVSYPQTGSMFLTEKMMWDCSIHSMLEGFSDPQYLMWSELQATEIQISVKEASFHMLLRSLALL